MRPATGPLLRWLHRAHRRAQPGRTLISVAAVAIGVALALAIHLVNASALDAFRQAIATVNGDADAQLRADQGWLDEGLLDAVSAVPGIAIASPVLEVSLHPEPDAGTDATGRAAEVRAAARSTALPLIAHDLFQSARVTPALLPAADPAATATGQDAGTGLGGSQPLFDADAIFLSDAARARWPQPTLRIRRGDSILTLRVAGGVPGAAPGQLVAVMDLGAAQWAFGAVGRLSRIDLKLQPGSALDAVEARLRALLPASVRAVPPQASEQRMSNLSRAYRVNLNVLALVALLTGGFIVFATMSLAAVRQQPEMALLRVLGAPPSLPARSLLVQGAWIGAVGALAGVAAGVGIAALLMKTVGGDLGGGYFSGTADALSASPLTLAGFGLLGFVTALAGAVAPAFGARRMAPARLLKAGSPEETWRTLRGGRTALVLIGTGIGLLFSPPWFGLPIAAYLAIAAFLFAGVALVPRVVHAVLDSVARAASARLWRRPVAWLALTRQAQAPASVAVALAGIVASFALTSAMVIMVASFRLSVDDWLGTVLPADLYARAPVTVTASIDATMREAIRRQDGVARAQFLRSVDLSLSPAMPPVQLLARTLDGQPIVQQLPLTGPLLTAPRPAPGSAAPTPVPVYVSEAMVSRYGFTPGSEQTIPLGARRVPVFIAGVWRDYARQTGAITIDLGEYRRLTGDETVSDVAIWLATGARPAAVMDAVRGVAPPLADADFRSASELRALSLRIFDRSFAVTYVLEAIAIVVGLFGVASTYAAEALNRAREFGMMRHLGVTRRMIITQLGLEACIGTAIAVGWGGLIGTIIGAVLIGRVNPQSFHWTMDLAMPWGLLVPSALALVATAVGTAMLATRSASAETPLRAVRQDW